MSAPRPFTAGWLAGLLVLGSLAAGRGQTPVVTVTNLPLRMVAANVTSGNYQRYESPGTNILTALRPDVVAIQEFKFASPTGKGTNTPAAFREMVDACFGTNFSYYRETGYDSGIPNGVISRWPIVASGSWDSPQVPDRGYAWAQIRPPGTNDLYVVSVHLHTASSGSRATEAGVIKSNIQLFFPPSAWVIVAGDFNTDSRTETAVTTFKTFLSDQPIPADQSGNANTSAPRSKPYDYVLPSFSLTNFLIATVMGTQTHPTGLVFDSRVYSPLAEVTPVLSTDSGAVNMQHMAVAKDLRIRWAVTNYSPGILAQPQPQTVPSGATAVFSVIVAGTAPLQYQWRRNGSILAGATQSALFLTNVVPASAGNFTVVVTNAFGAATSQMAALTVLVPPTVAQPPANQTVSQAAAATFSVVADGSAPLAYQWRFHGTNLPGANASAFVRTSAQPETEGPYAVVVTNGAGSVTSATARLSLIVPAPRVQIPGPSLLCWTGLSNLAYRVESCTNLARPDWISLGLVKSPSNLLLFTNSAPADTTRWYRVVYP